MFVVDNFSSYSKFEFSMMNFPYELSQKLLLKGPPTPTIFCELPIPPLPPQTGVPILHNLDYCVFQTVA